MSPKATILIVDDEPDLREVLEEYFVAQGYTALSAESATAARALAAEHPVDLALLDIAMPGEDGLSLARHLRERYRNVAIVMLTSAGTVVDRIVGLEIGADDYVTKPFDPRELLARIKSVLRRARSLPENLKPQEVACYRFAGWTLDIATRNLAAPDRVVIPLSGTEFRLLRIFLDHPNRVLTRDQLIDLMLSRDAAPFDRAIDVQVSRLRHRLREDAKEPAIIKTVRSQGYVFAAHVDAVA
jgi:two-component system OmpR family response regulator